MNTKSTLQREDLFKLKFIQPGQVSPNGQYAVYGLLESDLKANQNRIALWLTNLTTGEARQLTSGQSRDSAPAWSPDGEQIAFMSSRGEKPQIYLIAADGGEARQITHLRQGVGSGPIWSPDGQQIAFTAGPEAGDPPYSDKPYRVTRSVYRFDSVGYLDPVAQDLYIQPIEGGEAQRLVSNRAMNRPLAWSPDGREILYVTSLLPDEFGNLGAILQAVDLKGNSREVVNREWGGVGTADWTPDGRHVVFIGTPRGKPIGSKSDLYVVDASGGEPVNRTVGLGVGVGRGTRADMPVPVLAAGPLPVTADGKAVFVDVQIGGCTHIYRVSLGGKENWKPIITGDRSCLLMGMSEETRQICFTVSDINDPLQLHIANFDGRAERQLTNINTDLLAERAMPTFERMLYPGSDGVQVEGWIIKPAVGKAPYPAVLYIHGGPHGAFGRMFHADMQILAGAGYAVLSINHRASTGYGDSFSTAIKGDWGNLDYNDLMCGVDYAIEKGLVDPDRLGCAGLSGGGNLSCWIVGHTDRFKAAVPENPVSDWLSFYGTSDIGVYFGVEELGGHPWEVPDLYRKCSPLTYAHHCKTPTLMVQGEHDWRCPPGQSEAFYAVLKAVGCTVEMLRLPKGYHAASISGTPVIRKAQNDALLDWMNRYVLGKIPESDII